MLGIAVDLFGTINGCRFHIASGLITLNSTIIQVSNVISKSCQSNMLNTNIAPICL